MKKIIIIILLLIRILQLAGCGSGSTSDVKIDYGSSLIYSQKDMDDAISKIEKEFHSWNGCELHSITYSSDDACNNSESIAWMNELEEANDAKEIFTQCIMFTSSFHSPIKGGDAWEADKEYTDWQWWLGRADGGEWKLMTWGY